MNLNNVQIKMMQDLQSGITKPPATSEELYALISSVLLAVDIEAIEKPFLDKCRAQIVRTYFLYSEADGEKRIYLSRIKNQLVRREYFKTFRAMCTSRNADPFQEAYRSLIKDGYLKSDGLMMTMTEDSKILIGAK